MSLTSPGAQLHGLGWDFLPRKRLCDGFLASLIHPWRYVLQPLTSIASMDASPLSFWAAACGVVADFDDTALSWLELGLNPLSQS